MKARTRKVEQRYCDACERYAELGVDCGQALECACPRPAVGALLAGRRRASASKAEANLAGSGLAVTGRYPGRARNIVRAAAGLGQGVLADTGQAPAEPARDVWRLGRRAA